jgi:hypothetical protein
MNSRLAANSGEILPVCHIENRKIEQAADQSLLNYGSKSKIVYLPLAVTATRAVLIKSKK